MAERVSSGFVTNNYRCHYRFYDSDHDHYGLLVYGLRFAVGILVVWGLECRGLGRRGFSVASLGFRVNTLPKNMLALLMASGGFRGLPLRGARGYQWVTCGGALCMMFSCPLRHIPYKERNV